MRSTCVLITAVNIINDTLSLTIQCHLSQLRHPPRVPPRYRLSSPTSDYNVLVCYLPSSVAAISSITTTSTTLLQSRNWPVTHHHLNKICDNIFKPRETTPTHVFWCCVAPRLSPNWMWFLKLELRDTTLYTDYCPPKSLILYHTDYTKPKTPRSDLDDDIDLDVNDLTVVLSFLRILWEWMNERARKTAFE